MILESIIAFTSTVTLLVVSPGPNTALILKNVPFHGKRKGILNVLGIVGAINIHGLFSMLGVSSILLASATLFSILKIAGAIYLCVLGIKTIVNSFRAGNERNQKQNRLTQYNRMIFSSGFSEGFLTNLLNPKPALFYIAAFSQFFSFEASFLEIYFLVLIHSFVALLWYSTVVMGTQQLKGLFISNGSLSRYFQRATGAVFIYFGYLLATSRK